MTVANTTQLTLCRTVERQFSHSLCLRQVRRPRAFVWQQATTTSALLARVFNCDQRKNIRRKCIENMCSSSCRRWMRRGRIPSPLYIVKGKYWHIGKTELQFDSEILVRLPSLHCRQLLHPSRVAVAAQYVVIERVAPTAFFVGGQFQAAVLQQSSQASLTSHTTHLAAVTVDMVALVSRDDAHRPRLPRLWQDRVGASVTTRRKDSVRTDDTSG